MLASSDVAHSLPLEDVDRDFSYRSGTFRENEIINEFELKMSNTIIKIR
jgi:hypothetical protein